MLSSLLLPVSNTEIHVEERKFFNFYYSNSDEFPDLSTATIALIGNGSDICKNVRKSIENFKNHFKNIQILDLGNVLNDEDQHESLFSELKMQKIIPVFIGFNASVAHKWASLHKQDIHFVCNNLPFIAYEDNQLKHYIGYQRHLFTLEEIYDIDQNSFNSLSLGRLRSNINNVEPNLRDTEVLYVNLNVVRYSDSPNTIGSLPAGLTSEELCQIMKYAGTSNKVSAIYLDADLKTMDAHAESNLLALSFWYFLEGINMKINDHPAISNDFSGYIINGSISQDIEFIRHNISQKWWMKLTDENEDVHFLPCSNDEYTQTVADEIPDRLLKFINHY